MKQNKIHEISLQPTIKSERIVVDEVFDSGLARLLRAKRNATDKQDDFSIDSWGKEREDFIESWRVEAFVGFQSGRKLQEGDVFIIVDGPVEDVRKKNPDKGIRFTGHPDAKLRSGTVVALFPETKKTSLICCLGEPVSKNAPLPEM